MKWQLVKLTDVNPSAWKNGGGVTRELLAWPGADDWRVRISVADVESDGAFSRFEGVERWFAVLEGAGVHLSVGPVEQCLGVHDMPLRFDGAADAHARLVNGTTRDLNLMTRGSGRMDRIDSPAARTIEAGTLVAMYVHVGEASLAERSSTLAQEPIPVAGPALAWSFIEERIELRIDTMDAIWMEARS